MISYRYNTDYQHVKVQSAFYNHVLMLYKYKFGSTPRRKLPSPRLVTGDLFTILSNLLQKLRMPPQFVDQVDLGTVTIRCKPFRDSEVMYTKILKSLYADSCNARRFLNLKVVASNEYYKLEPCYYEFYVFHILGACPNVYFAVIIVIYTHYAS